MDAPAADRMDAALAVAGRVAQDYGCTDELRLLHSSNNVVVRCGSLVFKVSADSEKAERDVVVAAHASSRGGPALPPVGGVAHQQGFVVSVWPYVHQAGAQRSADRDAAEALSALHESLLDAPIALPALADRFVATRALLADETATSALDARDRATLLRAVDLVSLQTHGDAVLHTEPHDRNRVTKDGAVLYIDFEAACIGPIEWDLAYLPEDLALAVWPEHDPHLRSILTLGVSTCVATACWRHVSARPDDAEMRWHASHHLSLVRRRQ